MRVAVLEWICGGGLIDTLPEQVPTSLRAEGWSMLQTLVAGFSQGGVELSVAADRRLIPQLELAQLAERPRLTVVDTANFFDTPSAWTETARACELALVIAPETGNVLVDITECLRAQGVSLLNCSTDFLATASDKIATARVLQQHRISHPPTRLLGDADINWLRSVKEHSRQDGPVGNWVVKPVDGAGGNDLQVLDDEELERQLLLAQKKTGSCRKARKLVVQPCLAGLPLSCSAIVDSRGKCHWLPIVSQDFANAIESRVSQRLEYIGCTLPPEGVSTAPPTQLLNRVVQAFGAAPLGWVGVDLLYDTVTQSWCVIEVNPRCTSSLSGLCLAYSGNLAMELLQAGIGELNRLQGSFAPTIFRLPA